jgi:hypothetical protein
MRHNELVIGREYVGKVSGKSTTVKLLDITNTYEGRKRYKVKSLTTGREMTWKSAQKFRYPVPPATDKAQEKAARKAAKHGQTGRRKAAKDLTHKPFRLCRTATTYPTWAEAMTAATTAFRKHSITKVNYAIIAQEGGRFTPAVFPSKEQTESFAVLASEGVAVVL